VPRVDANTTSGLAAYEEGLAVEAGDADLPEVSIDIQGPLVVKPAETVQAVKLSIPVGARQSDGSPVFWADAALCRQAARRRRLLGFAQSNCRRVLQREPEAKLHEF
jgi:hypothetical protein